MLTTVSFFSICSLFSSVAWMCSLCYAPMHVLFKYHNISIHFICTVMHALAIRSFFVFREIKGVILCSFLTSCSF